MRKLTVLRFLFLKGQSRMKILQLTLCNHLRDRQSPVL